MKKNNKEEKRGSRGDTNVKDRHCLGKSARFEQGDQARKKFLRYNFVKNELILNREIEE